MPLEGRWRDRLILLGQGPGRLYAFGQHPRVADLVRQQQDQPRVQQLRVLLGKARVRVEQLLVEPVRVLEMELGLHRAPACACAAGWPSDLSIARTRCWSTASPVAARYPSGRTRAQPWPGTWQALCRWPFGSYTCSRARAWPSGATTCTQRTGVSVVSSRSRRPAAAESSPNSSTSSRPCAHSNRSLTTPCAPAAVPSLPRSPSGQSNATFCTDRPPLASQTRERVRLDGALGRADQVT